MRARLGALVVLFWAVWAEFIGGAFIAPAIGSDVLFAENVFVNDTTVKEQKASAFIDIFNIGRCNRELIRGSQTTHGSYFNNRREFSSAGNNKITCNPLAWSVGKALRQFLPVANARADFFDDGGRFPVVYEPESYGDLFNRCILVARIDAAGNGLKRCSKGRIENHQEQMSAFEYGKGISRHFSGFCGTLGEVNRSFEIARLLLSSSPQTGSGLPQKKREERNYGSKNVARVSKPLLNPLDGPSDPGIYPRLILLGSGLLSFSLYRLLLRWSTGMADRGWYWRGWSLRIAGAIFFPFGLANCWIVFLSLGDLLRACGWQWGEQQSHTDRQGKAYTSSNLTV